MLYFLKRIKNEQSYIFLKDYKRVRLSFFEKIEKNEYSYIFEMILKMKRLYF